MMYRIGNKLPFLSAVGVILLLGACTGPMEEVDVGSGREDASFSSLDKALDALANPCAEGTSAYYVKVNDGWCFRPCDGCDSIPIETLWGGNTGQHVEIEQTLDAMSADVPGQEISLLRFSQHVGECP